MTLVRIYQCERFSDRRRLMFVQHVRWLAVVLAAVLSLDTQALAQLERSSAGAAREYVAATFALSEPFELPSNLDVSPKYRAVVDAMVRLSPTFRRQLRRIANETNLAVVLRGSLAQRSYGARATTRFARHTGGGLTADIELMPLEDDVELIAHEIEHVIEVIDGVDLVARAALPDTGVRAKSSDNLVFETVRAKRIGLKVTQEVRAGGGRGD
jgi:hypothetical protein